MRTNHKLSIHILKWWKAGVVLSLLMALTMTNSSCEKDCTCDTEVPDPDTYYVKYEVTSSTIYLGKKMDATINNENNGSTTYSIGQGGAWNTTIGPVQKGFLGSLLVVASDTTYQKLRLNAYIYVSKNGEPFVLKESDASDDLRDSVGINYVIDF